MVSMVVPRQDERSDDLLVVDSPPLRGRFGEAAYADNPLLTARPSLVKRASRAFIRYLVACCVGVAGTLAWQSYGDAAKQTIAAWGAEQGWSMTWLYVATASPSPQPQRTEAGPVARAAPQMAPAGGSSSDLQDLKTMTLGLAADLTTLRQRIEQMAAGQEQTTSDIAKLQAAEQEIRHKLAAIAGRPVAPAPSKPTPIAPARAPTPTAPR